MKERLHEEIGAAGGGGESRKEREDRRGEVSGNDDQCQPRKPLHKKL